MNPNQFLAAFALFILLHLAFKVDAWRRPECRVIEPLSITSPRRGSYSKSPFGPNCSVMSLFRCRKVISTSGSVGRQGMTASNPWVVEIQLTPKILSETGWPVTS